MPSGRPLEISEERVGDDLIVRPEGEIDLSRSPALRERLMNAMNPAPTRLVIDLAGVPYMDSSGVATFVEAMQLARRAGCSLVLCGLQERVRSIFEIARLDMVFEIVETTEDALK